MSRCFLLMSLLFCIAASVSSLWCAEQPPSRVPDQATVDAWAKDLDGADPAKRRDAIARIQDAFERCRHVEAEAKRDKLLLQDKLAENENLTQEFNKRNEQFTQKCGNILRLQQQVYVMEQKERFDFNKALARATEQVRKSGNADEKAALLELENQQLKQVIAQYNKESGEVRKAAADLEQQCAEALFRLENYVYEARRLQHRGQEPDVVSVLVRVLSVSDWGVQAKAAHLLGLLNPLAEAALPALKDALKDRSGIVRAMAAQAIWRIEKKKDAVLPVLLTLVESDRSAAPTAAQVLSHIGRQDASVVEPLVNMLQNASAEVILDAAWALQAIGPNAKSAVPALETAAKDQRPVVSEAAKQALQKINEPVLPKKEP